MDVKNLTDLAKIINVCRKKGIESIRIAGDSIELRFTDEAVRPKERKASKAQGDLAPESNGLTNEELLLWSVHSPDETLGN